MTRVPPHDDADRSEPGSTALRSSGLIWLVVAFVAGLVYVAALLLLRDGQAGIATAGIVLDAAIFVAMLITRVAVRGIPARLGTLAAEFIAMSLVSLVCLVQLAIIAPIS